jgi:hypothetical protein
MSDRDPIMDLIAAALEAGGTMWTPFRPTPAPIPYECVDLDDGDWRPMYAQPIWASSIEQAREKAERRGLLLRCDLPTAIESAE